MVLINIRNIFFYKFLNRSTKRPVQYIETVVLSEDDGSDTELVATCRDSDNELDKVTEPSPKKKAKVSKRAILAEEKPKSTRPKTAKKESKEKRTSKNKKKKKGRTTKPVKVSA